MGLSWQQGPLGEHPAGKFLTEVPMPEKLLFAEPLRRRMRVRFAGEWIADSEDVWLLHEPGRYPVAYFPVRDVSQGVLEDTDRTTKHRELGPTAWYTVRSGDKEAGRAAWRYTDPPGYAAEFQDRVAFAWRAMDGFYEEDERVLGHAADMYHRIDIRNTSRTLEVRDGERTVARTESPLVLFESGFAPRWYVPRTDVDEDALTPVEGQTFCPYKGLADYYEIGGVRGAAWSYRDAYTQVAPVSDMVSFEPDKVAVYLDGERLALEPGQAVVPHGIDRGLDAEELSRAGGPAKP
ncbi:DUF427 domain-containing protein [Streptomyces sp. TS71-3]|uniref:DUF427 domain-containing protein n=1 Tax=Streptomyces sp. TS71-3 TaxID=2733862 RepID=UPI001B172521|nr:DUF427 domain-containing protein [Streptomyces sp. TS71-3]GHJ41011.1 hypothetical protein Sm713_66200 [Streptomyces sp. TS71-3]